MKDNKGVGKIIALFICALVLMGLTPRITSMNNLAERGGDPEYDNTFASGEYIDNWSNLNFDVWPEQNYYEVTSEGYYEDYPFDYEEEFKIISNAADDQYYPDYDETTDYYGGAGMLWMRSPEQMRRNVDAVQLSRWYPPFENGSYTEGYHDMELEDFFSVIIETINRYEWKTFTGYPNFLDSRWISVAVIGRNHLHTDLKFARDQNGNGFVLSDRDNNKIIFLSEEDFVFIWDFLHNYL